MITLEIILSTLLITYSNLFHPPHYPHTILRHTAHIACAVRLIQPAFATSSVAYIIYITQCQDGAKMPVRNFTTVLCAVYISYNSTAALVYDNKFIQFTR